MQFTEPHALAFATLASPLLRRPHLAAATTSTFTIRRPRLPLAPRRLPHPSSPSLPPLPPPTRPLAMAAPVIPAAGEFPGAPLPSPVSQPASVVGRTPVFAQTMLRIKHPAKSHTFYTDGLNMRLLTRLDFADFSFSLFFYAYSDAEAQLPSTVTQSARVDFLWSIREPTLELTWNWPQGAVDYDDAVARLERGVGDDGEVYVSGNGEADGEPLGFGFVQVAVNDVSAAVQDATAGGGTVNESGAREATLADPDGYHVRLVERSASTASGTTAQDHVLSSSMLRVQDPRDAVGFFQALGFRLLGRHDDAERHCTDMFVAYVGADVALPDADALADGLRDLRAPTLTLRHLWGREHRGAPALVNGNVKPFRGFGHIGIIVDDVGDVVERCRGQFEIVREAKPFADAGVIAFVAEPLTQYWVELITRVGEAPAELYEKPAV